MFAWQDEAVHPALAIAHHLQRNGFRKKAYVLAGEAFRQYLREVGVVVGPEQRVRRTATGVMRNKGNFPHKFIYMSLKHAVEKA